MVATARKRMMSRGVPISYWHWLRFFAWMSVVGTIVIHLCTQLWTRDVVNNNNLSVSTVRTRSSPRYTARQLLNKTLFSMDYQLYWNTSAPALSSSTLVAAYFSVPAKHDESQYWRWMMHFTSLRDPMILFTEPRHVSRFQHLRQHAMNRTVIIVLPRGVYDLPIAKLAQQEQYTNDNNNDNHNDNYTFWQHQLEMDPERRRHQAYFVFWIWLSKSWFVQQAMLLNPFHSSLFVYSDMGCFRHAMYENKQLIQQPHVVPAEQILWMAHRVPNAPPTLLWNNKIVQPQYFFHSGAVAAGTMAAWRTFHEQFATVLDQFVAQQLFVGDDQCVLQSTCRSFPRSCAYITYDQVPDNHYFGLRYVLHFAAATNDQNYTYWRMPLLTTKHKK